MKQRLDVSIDENVLEMVRDNIPNKSQFVEDCFRAYLTFVTENEEERGEELRQAWQDFHKAKLAIHLLTKIDYEGKDIERAVEKQKTGAWLYVWADYRKFGSAPEYKIEKSAKTLDIEIDVLNQLLRDTLYLAKMDMTKLYIFDSWNYIAENVLPYVEVDDDEGGLDELLGE